VKKPFIIGVTGGFGTGKSTVAKIFEKLGAVRISADELAHKAIMPEGAAYKKVIALFGAEIVKKDKRIDRRRLARMAFADKKKLKLLNGVVHPIVIAETKALMQKKSARGKIFAVEAPLLIESGMDNMVDALVVVTAKRETGIRRCRGKFKITRAEVLQRMRSQMPLAKKKLLADFIIDHDGSLSATRKRVERTWKKIRKYPKAEQNQK